MTSSGPEMYLLVYLTMNIVLCVIFCLPKTPASPVSLFSVWNLWVTGCEAGYVPSVLITNGLFRKFRQYSELLDKIVGEKLTKWLLIDSVVPLMYWGVTTICSLPFEYELSCLVYFKSSPKWYSSDFLIPI